MLPLPNASRFMGPLTGKVHWLAFLALGNPVGELGTQGTCWEMRWAGGQSRKAIKMRVLGTYCGFL